MLPVAGRAAADELTVAGRPAEVEEDADVDEAAGLALVVGFMEDEVSFLG